MTDHPPYSLPFELAALSERGAELSLSPDGAECSRIAAWLGALDLPRLTATVRLSRGDDEVYRYDAEFKAEVVQACVVTLEPVPSVHMGRAQRLFRVRAKPSRRHKQETEVVVVADDNEAPEVLSSSLLDLAAPILEELSLLLDPYPRAPGVKFEAPKEEADPKDSPFAVLAKLKVAPSQKPKSRK